MIYCSVNYCCSNSSIPGVLLHSKLKSIKTPNHPTYHWSTLLPLEVWVRGLYNSWWFCVHKLSMFIYLSMASLDNFLTIGPLLFSQIYTPDFLNFCYNISLIYKLQMFTWETRRTSLLAGGYDGGETPTQNFISHFYKKRIFMSFYVSALVWSS